MAIKDVSKWLPNIGSLSAELAPPTGELPSGVSPSVAFGNGDPFGLNNFNPKAGPIGGNGTGKPFFDGTGAFRSSKAKAEAIKGLKGKTPPMTGLEKFTTGVDIGKTFLDAFIGWKTLKLGEDTLAFGKQSYAENRRTDLQAYNDKNEANIRADNYRRPDQIAAGNTGGDIDALIAKTTLT